MPNYQDGKIYTIRHPDTEQYYLGSTTQKLCKRFDGHKRGRSTTAKILFELGIDQCYIELLENYPCNSKEELSKREGELIRLHKDNLVNIQIAGRTQKQYIEENKEIIAEKAKIYYQTNKEHKLNKVLIYANNNREKINQRMKIYNQYNKDIINEKRSQSFTCDCGQSYTLRHKARHNNTKKHQLFINQPTI